MNHVFAKENEWIMYFSRKMNVTEGCLRDFLFPYLEEKLWQNPIEAPRKFSKDFYIYPYFSRKITCLFWKVQNLLTFSPRYFYIILYFWRKMSFFHRKYNFVDFSSMRAAFFLCFLRRIAFFREFYCCFSLVGKWFFCIFRGKCVCIFMGDWIFVFCKGNYSFLWKMSSFSVFLKENGFVSWYERNVFDLFYIQTGRIVP